MTISISVCFFVLVLSLWNGIMFVFLISRSSIHFIYKHLTNSWYGYKNIKYRATLLVENGHVFLYSFKSES